MTVKRRTTKPVFIGAVQVGGDAPVVVQSMTSTNTSNILETVDQIARLEEAGCEIVRLAVPDGKAADALPDIRKQSPVPLIADIHFDHRLALRAIEGGADAIRINPGTMGREHLASVIEAARRKNVVIRIGINAGSLQKDILEKHGGPTADALVESALRTIAFFEDRGFGALKLSLKSSDVGTMIAACRGIAGKTDYPLHLGVTEAGGLVSSAVKSSIGLGVLLSEGIGDTIRVSITGDPLQEMPVAWGILRALDIRKRGPDIISCPTCGRCEIDLPALVAEVEARLSGMKEYLKIALMGCVVNGPGEAAEADIGIAGGRRSGVLFKKGTMVKKVAEEHFVDALMEEIRRMVTEEPRPPAGPAGNHRTQER
ncbi:MAG: flavodoxin-dependent (E)-4-hydroxy-3-methylbut-2-enyl-diphosphate synthase [Syntrophales bacterium]|jgi:(E)-4-hydroxy-3-methylbut-2-enyl-diphosphate synthase|nr:flavodoxin-dependent (E)-4-hydroxy-3-methylbut-2-enyl-diphosphate synthase [Syntrophales bacterium]MCK9528185.1 flavodoxin-dependent (E)-4-hydroxy-3-methylbut-2-enyl-diphosphate synthase [Syntrophales bacterium]MDX9921332.1 flavodoxin-dependent (E)-4-hydroxy-3-methylbut-2-enyl-diphosphate synthase [Syntrophales bacterium]